MTDTENTPKTPEKMQFDDGKIRELVEKRKAAEDEQYPEKACDPAETITPAFIMDCLYSNEMGDGCLYSELHKDRYLFNKNSEEWMEWNGAHWERDVMNRSTADVEDVAVKYLKESDRIIEEILEARKADEKDRLRHLEKKRGDLLSRVNRLRTERGRQNCLKFAHTSQTPLAIPGDRIDQRPMLLACRNCVIDLSTGLSRPGRQDDYLHKASPHEWKGIDEPAPVFEKTLTEILSGNEELMHYVNKLMGYGITGEISEHIFAVLSGQGRNGKGLLMESIAYALGDLVGVVQSEMLLDQGRMKSSSGPSPDIMALRGLRIAYASETDENQKFSPSRVKWLSGGDTLTGRNPHDKYPTSFLPTHILFLLTNHKPHAPADDFAFWERVRIVPFLLSFVDREPRNDNERRVDKTLKEKIWAEASGILAWLVRGCLLWQKEGLDPPMIVAEATAEYRRNEDLIGDFIDECCEVVEGGEENATDLYNRFVTWFELNIGKRCPKQRTFGNMMSRRFEKEKVGGKYKYYGLKLIIEDFTGD
ncbi:phage/plasmid primase, P4 family [uncultured Desulfosarcina sp.]|uniref:DNA primase family protein n=1 Tax=uncultured Desulfosarcina sp. TaxID=218289 RepID=UPI0029C7A557|nr:phage/plasmid primase, P4 family [uncultured Desulfosarcina sp.]